MKLTVIGSADASNSAGRGHSCYWLDGALSDGGLMVDFGATALMGLRSAGRDARELDAIVLTHLHGDHFGGLPFVLVDYIWIRGRNANPQRPFTIVGPVGTEERVNELLHVVYRDLPMADAVNFPLTWIELAPGDTTTLGGCTIEAFAADHMDPPEDPLCLRFTNAAGEVVAFSGDTLLCDGLRSAARGADLLVGDCTGIAPPVGRHATWEEWLPALPDLGCKHLLLSHMGEAVRAQAEELPKQAPPGLRVTVADDGLILEV